MRRGSDGRWGVKEGVTGEEVVSGGSRGGRVGVTGEADKESTEGGRGGRR